MPCKKTMSSQIFNSNLKRILGHCNYVFKQVRNRLPSTAPKDKINLSGVCGSPWILSYWVNRIWGWPKDGVPISKDGVPIYLRSEVLHYSSDQLYLWSHVQYGPGSWMGRLNLNSLCFISIIDSKLQLILSFLDWTDQGK